MNACVRWAVSEIVCAGFLHMFLEEDGLGMTRAEQDVDSLSSLKSPSNFWVAFPQEKPELKQ